MTAPVIKGNPQLDASLLPIYQEYRAVEGNEKITLWNYINMRADYDLAVAFSKLYWPDFVEVDGCILLAEAYTPASFERWKQSCKGDRQCLEATINETRIWDLFLNSSQVLERPTYGLFSNALFEYLAQVLSTCWRHALQEVFPDKQFTFDYWIHAPGDLPTITFYQTPQEPT